MSSSQIRGFKVLNKGLKLSGKFSKINKNFSLFRDNHGVSIGSELAETKFYLKIPDTKNEFHLIDIYQAYAKILIFSLKES